ncbi:MAG: hypothetical protein A3H98_05110 [Bacteroidetes bacterium RIFCSPLOWO2_02_FULL_36_8]|nr:MAG: hypothetical protein A3H98_05110 [Bacteroidetes bacterium RIFCSPLOWO2_02_FULL_36_8]OFY70196.1 MAG: hypothetical protein A3G23_08595 [Bacteroidetes bacterium RIFCSPLOWO2_12_FULL_37_12]
MKNPTSIIDRFAYNTTDSIETRFSKKLILIVAISCCCAGVVWSAMYFLFLGVGLTMVLPLVFVVIVGITIPISHFKRNHKFLIYSQLICITWVSALIQWSIGSLHDSGIVIAWSFLGPVGALLFLKRKQSYLWMAMFISIVLISVLIEPKWTHDTMNLTETARKIFYIMNLAFPASVVFMASLYFVSNLIEQKNLNYSLLRITENKNKEIHDSITYAKRIQQAKLPHINEIQKTFPNSFILFKPKDIVSGDFYYFHKNDKSVFIASADCTGHGVPGALMSMIGSEKIDDALAHTADTSEILRHLNKGIKNSLHQTDSMESTRDGMDIALCSVNTDARIVKYAGANRPIWIIRNGQTAVEEIKATKAAIGGLTEYDQQFETHTIQFHQGDTFYIFSDGYADQDGGDKGKRLMTKNFKRLLLDIQDKSMQKQEEYLDQFVDNWRGEKEQLDDILIIGVRL